VSLTQRSFVLVALTVLLAVIGLWSPDAALRRVWLLPAALLMLGLAIEGLRQRRMRIEAVSTAPDRARLGRALDLTVRWRSARPALLRFMADVPAGVEAESRAHTVATGPAGADAVIGALPVGLGRHRWPSLRGRVRGFLGLAWWTRRFAVPGELAVEPDLLDAPRRSAGTAAAGAAQRALAGSGSELLELREYRPGDPLRSIDWKASARASRWIARDRLAEQHLEIMLMLDVGRTSGVTLGRLTRLGHYVNAACRFAEHVVRNEDRIGLVTFADHPLQSFAPDQGIAAVHRLRAALCAAAPLARESNPLPAAMRALALCRQRALVVLMLDLDDVGSHGQLGQAVRLLRPKHLPAVCGLLDPDLYAFRRHAATRWLDPYVSLAAAEQIGGLHARAAALRQLGAPVVLRDPAQFEEAVFEAYDRMRARRRI
jgi:uncharacterized protein (DUF58 family)